MVRYEDVWLVHALASCLERQRQDYKATLAKLGSLRAEVIKTMESLERLGVRFEGGHTEALVAMLGEPVPRVGLLPPPWKPATRRST